MSFDLVRTATGSPAATSPLVSVCAISYNHARYVAEALHSVLDQKVSFPYEIVVADDCSTDGTREIALAVARESAVPFRFLPRSRRLGPWENYLALLAAARGRYVAYLETDDRWCDPSRLEDQVALLEAHSRFSGCFGRAVVVDQADRDVGDYFEYWHCSVPEAEVTQRTVLVRGSGAPSSTMLFRRAAIDPLPAWYRRDASHQGLGMVLTEHGPLAFVDRTWGRYRIHGGGMWSSGTAEQRNRMDLSYAVALASDRALTRRYPREIGRRLAVATAISARDRLAKPPRLRSLVNLYRDLLPAMTTSTARALTAAVPDLVRFVAKRLAR